MHPSRFILLGAAALFVAATSLLVTAQHGPVTTAFTTISLNSGSKNLVNNGWTFRNSTDLNDHPATVPGEVYTDLCNAGLIPDPVVGFNDYATQWVSLGNWTFRSYFNFDFPTEPRSPVELVFDGVQTRCDVFVNGHAVGSTRDAFQRYAFPVAQDFLQYQNNELKVACQSAVRYGRSKAAQNPGSPLAPGYLGGITMPPGTPNAGKASRNFVRQAQSYSGWDWGIAAESTGITRDVYLRVFGEYTSSGEEKQQPLSGIKKQQRLSEQVILPYTIDYVTSRTYPVNGKPTKEELPAPLQDSNNTFLLVVDVHLRCASFGANTCFRDGIAVSAASAGGRNVATSFTPTSKGPCIAGTVCAAVAQVKVTVKDVLLWWPAFMNEGALNVGVMYNLTVDVVSRKQQVVARSVRRVGFRSVEIITDGDPLNYGLPPSKRKPSKKTVLFFRINGVPNFIRGANFVPFDNFEGRVNSTVRTWVLGSALAAGFNALRVWGGGQYMSDEFYDYCDENGLMIWSEQRFACSPYPDSAEFLGLVADELTHQVRRLSSHPSIIVWSGNNEDMQPYGNTAAYKKLNYGTVIQTIVEQDDSRPVLPASPSCGFATGFTSAGLPAGTMAAPAPFDVVAWPCNGKHGHDTHYYNYQQCTPFSGGNPPLFPETQFASEFGFQSLPLYNQWQQVTTGADQNQFWSGLMVHRQHHPDGQAQMQKLISGNFRTPAGFFDNRTQAAFQRAIYLSQLQQTLCIAGEAAFYRRARDLQQRTMGTLYWQLNTVWAAPSWSSLERSWSPATGLNTGAWKMLHYGMASAYSRVAMVPYINATDKQLYLHALTDLMGTNTRYGLFCVNGVKIYMYPSTMSSPEPKPDYYFFDRASRVFWEPLRGITAWQKPLSDLAAAPHCGGSLSNCIVVFESECEAGLKELNPSPVFFALDSWKNVPLAPSKIDVILSASTADSISVIVNASAISPFVYLEAPDPWASMGRWSMNNFLLIPGKPLTVTFTCLEYEGSWCAGSWAFGQAQTTFLNNIRVQKLNE